MYRRSIILALLVLLTVAMAGCGGGGSNSNVNTLWSDVPGLPQAEKANIKLPLPLRLIMQAAVKASASDSDVDLEKFDVVGYTTDMAPNEVTEYYSQERMTAAGWNLTDQPGCMGGADAAGAAGGMCMYGKDDGKQQSLLVILPASDDDSGKTQVFYIRFDGQLSGS